MVKQAEKVKKTSPLMPVFGLIVAGGLAFIAYSIVPEIRKLAFMKPFNEAVLNLPKNQQPWGNLGLAFILWILMLAIAFFIVALIAGKDPNTPSKMSDRKIRKRN